MLANYIDVLSTYYPNVKAGSLGAGYEYEQLQWEAGDPLPSKTELDVKALELAQLRAWLAIQVERDRRKSGGIKVGANWFHSDDPSRIQQLGLVMMGANLPAGIMWKTLGGSFVLMTPLLAQQIFMTSAASDQAIFAKAEYHKAMMLQAPIPSQYNYLTGWPLTYGE
jgi:hypothetical protein